MRKIISRFGWVEGLILLIIVALLAFSGWRLWDHHNKTAKEAARNSRWTEYVNQSYGFKFAYPKSWGAPVVSQIPEQNGQSYTISFRKLRPNYAHPPKPTQAIMPAFSMSFESAGVTHSNCAPNGQCEASHALAAPDIKKVLSGDKKDLAKYDSTSYAIIFSDLRGGVVSGLNFYQTVDLPKPGVTAVKASYYNMAVSSSEHCPINQISQDTRSNCITQSVFDTVGQLVKSLQAV